MKLFLNFRRIGSKTILLQAFLLIVAGMPGFCSNSDYINHSPADSIKNKNHKSSGIGDRLEIFYPLSNAEYSITICADLPDNDNPKCVFKKGEPGHVFLILTKEDTIARKSVSRSFGFYPQVPVSCLFVQVRSKILDNSDREYDASISKKVTPDEFGLILKKSKEFSKKKYNLKKYNCYDYVLEVFNSLPGIEKLPVSKVKFPLIFGRGGSPCCLYRDLLSLLAKGSAWAPFIRFGRFKSPASDTSQQLMASF